MNLNNLFFLWGGGGGILYNFCTGVRYFTVMIDIYGAMTFSFLVSSFYFFTESKGWHAFFFLIGTYFPADSSV